MPSLPLRKRFSKPGGNPESAHLKPKLVVLGLNQPEEPEIDFPADELDSALREAVEQTGAAGAAIALETGGHLQCRTSWGMAPPVGSRLNPDSGITGLCFRSGEPLLCRDTEEDTRVDAEACRALGVRSVLVVPVVKDGRRRGIVELFSSQPGTFTDSHIAALGTLTNRLVGSDPPAEVPAQPATEVPEKKLMVRDAEALPPRPQKRSPWSRTAIAVAVIAAGVVAYATQMRRSESVTAHAKAVHPAVAAKAVPAPPAQLSITEDDLARTESRIQGKFSGGKLGSVRARAQAGDGAAAYDLAERYADGAGLQRDYGQAMFWFTQAASKGNASAQWKLGLGYLKGVGVAQSSRTAAEWFLRAANQAHIGAQVALSELYFSGEGVPRDYVRAYTWAMIAAQTTNQNNDSLNEIAAQMTPEQLADAQHRVSLWWEHRVPPQGR